METEVQVIGYDSCIIRQEMHQEVIETPQGTMVHQIPVNIPVFFRNMKEVTKFLEEHKKQGASEITLYVGARDIAQECEWVYPTNNTERTAQ
jgi:hypothetical protein